MANFKLTIDAEDGMVTIKGDADFDPGDDLTPDQKACMLYVQGVLVAINTIRGHIEVPDIECDPSNPEFH